MQEEEGKGREVEPELVSFAQNYLNDMRDCGLTPSQAMMVAVVMLSVIFNMHDDGEQREEAAKTCVQQALKWSNQIRFEPLDPAEPVTEH